MLWSRGPTPPTIVPIHRSPPVEAVALCTAVDAASFAEADVMSLAAAHTRNSILFRAALLQKDALGKSDGGAQNSPLAAHAGCHTRHSVCDPPSRARRGVLLELEEASVGVVVAEGMIPV